MFWKWIYKLKKEEDFYVKIDTKKKKKKKICKVDYECSYNINIGIDLKRCIACACCLFTSTLWDIV